MTIGELLARLGLEDELSPKLQVAANNITKFGSAMEAASGKMVAGGAALSAGVTAPLIALGAASIKMSEQIRMASLSFTTMLGSAQAAGKMLADLKTFAATTPFQFPDLVTASKRMLAMGIAANDIIPTLRAVGDASAALGANAETVNRITLALGQMTAKGKVSAEEMRQLAEAGIPAWDSLAKSIGVSVPVAMKQAEKGLISGSQGVTAIIAGMNKKFGGMMAETSKTFTGVWSNFQDEMNFALADVGDTLAPILTAIVRDFGLPLLGVIKDLARGFAELPAPLQMVVIGVAAIAASAGPLLLAFGGLAFSITSIVGVLGLFAPAATVASAAATQLAAATAAAAAASASPGAMAAAAQAAGVAATQSTSMFTKFGAALTSVGSAAMSTIKALGSLTFAQIGTGISAGFGAASTAIKTFATTAATGLGSFGSSVSTALSQTVSLGGGLTVLQAGAALAAGAIGAQLGTALLRAGDEIRGLNDDISAADTAVRKGVESVGLLTGAWSLLSGALSGMDDIFGNITSRLQEMLGPLGSFIAFAAKAPFQGLAAAASFAGSAFQGLGKMIFSAAPPASQLAAEARDLAQASDIAGRSITDWGEALKIIGSVSTGARQAANEATAAIAKTNDAALNAMALTDQNITATLKKLEADKKIKDAQELMGPAVRNLADAEKVLAVQTALSGDASKAAADKVRQHAEEIQNLADNITGAAATMEGAKLSEALAKPQTMQVIMADSAALTRAHEQIQQVVQAGGQITPVMQEVEAVWRALDPAIREGSEGMKKFFEESAELARKNTEEINKSFDEMAEKLNTAFSEKVRAALDFGETFGQAQGQIDQMVKSFTFIETALGGLGAQTDAGLQKMGEALAKGAGSSAELAAALAKVNAEIAKRRGQPILNVQEIAAAAEKIRQLEMAFQNLAQIAGLFGDRFGAGVGIIGEMVIALEKGADRFETIATAVAKLGDVIGGKLGGALQGGASGAMAGDALSKALGFAGPAGAIIGGALGFISGIFGSAKKKAAELKKKQEEAMSAFSSMFDEWKNLRNEIAGKGTEGVNAMIGGLFDSEGKFTGEFTSAANAAAYVADQFAILRASGMSTSAALAAMEPALTAMAKDAKAFAGSAAAPLLAMSKFAGANQKLLAFVDGLGASASSLAAFNMFTQEAANRIGADMTASFDKMIGKGLSYEQALAMSADALFKIQNAATKAGVSLDAHTQKLIVDAQSAGLFEGLEDPMQKLIALQGAMVAAMGQLVSLMGGQVPAAIQKMIDEFNSATISVNVDVTATTTTTPESVPDKPPPELQHGTRGLVNWGPQGTLAMLHNKEAVVPEAEYKQLLQPRAVTDARQFNITQRAGESGEMLARRIVQLSRNNFGGAQTSLGQGYRG